jgi:hypothetical protein
MNDQQKADRLAELFGEGIEWDPNYYESNGEFGFEGQARLLNIAYRVEQELQTLAADAQAKAKRIKKLIDRINN